jgi:putative spermidine/putrescine transport system substrate-binding protein
MWNTRALPVAPTSWGALYDPAFRGRIAVPDTPMQIADAALYLRTAQPSLGITDPYELNRAQFDAAVELLRRQRPLVQRYWQLPSDEIDAFKTGKAVLGSAWLSEVSTLQAAKQPVSSTIPKEGTTGWADSWMVVARSKHPNCAYMWLRYMASASVQSQVARFYGATPSNAGSCRLLGERLCTAYHADADATYLGRIAFWRTPVANCGVTQCMTWAQWVKAWQRLRR